VEQFESIPHREVGRRWRRHRPWCLQGTLGGGQGSVRSWGAPTLHPGRTRAHIHVCFLAFTSDATATSTPLTLTLTLDSTPLLFQGCPVQVSGYQQ
jgi:hypothetical protein